MFHEKGAEWKTLLGSEDEEKLNEVIKSTAKHREAYSKAENIKIAQMWCALLEMRKQQEELEARLMRLEDIFRAAGQRLQERQQIRESLEKF